MFAAFMFFALLVGLLVLAVTLARAAQNSGPGSSFRGTPDCPSISSGDLSSSLPIHSVSFDAASSHQAASTHDTTPSSGNDCSCDNSCGCDSGSSSGSGGGGGSCGCD